MSGRTARLVGRALIAIAGAGATRVALRAATSMSSERSKRINYRGRTVDLAAGPAITVAASVAAGGAAMGHRQPRLAGAYLVAGLGAGAIGFYDDVLGARPEHKGTKGFRGHLSALREGRVTSGLVKMAGVSAAGLAAAALLPPPPHRRRLVRLRRGIDVALGAGVIAGTANLVNLFDLRPGRALKASALISAPMVLAAAPAPERAFQTGQPNGSAALAARVSAAASAAAVAASAAGVLGATSALLPDDLGERVMIGDSGANAVGALLGVGLAARTGTVGRAVALAGLVGLTAASEKVSFTKVIESTPVLRQLDQLGRIR